MAKTRFLNPELIVRTAFELGDRDGAEAMSMRRIASELGCDPMALYRHFANREALLDAVADLAFAEVAAPDPGLPWDERIGATAESIRETSLRHPGIAAHIAARPPMGRNGQRIAVGMVAALASTGLPPATAIQCLQTLVAYLASSLSMAVRAGARDQRWEQVRDVMNGLPGATVPGDELFVVGSDEQFRFGLRLLMAGIRAEVAAATGTG
ncbi:TetR/AcrR family transcriptional regulator [Streptomyces sp. SBT349]|uniref:TetR/AcrR family transcriptional regulator n=1 Tax=Streptomyces sp. SBT349 TaxID=1580539 RepID=UPI00066DC1D3|nr:TetR/AcrR family transcriptional regulator C-terminal domain-containing protein [Streptomyces sp. SBT349]